MLPGDTRTPWIQNLWLMQGLNLGSVHICTWLFVLNVWSRCKISQVLSSFYLLLSKFETYNTQTIFSLYFYISWKMLIFLKVRTEAYLFNWCLAFRSQGLVSALYNTICLWGHRCITRTSSWKCFGIFIFGLWILDMTLSVQKLPFRVDRSS